MSKTAILLMLTVCAMGCSRERSIDASVPSSACIATTLQHVPLGTSVQRATATLESLGLSCMYKRDNPTWADGKTWRQDTIYTEVVETNSVFSESRFVPTLYLKDGAVTEVRATPRRSMTVSNNGSEDIAADAPNPQP